jgi:UPF0271 protein
MIKSIDLNCDLGEGVGEDAQIMEYVSSVNIACGFHAGNASTMAETVKLAVAKQVKIGAHPSFLDLENFGRKEMNLPAKEVYDIVLYQLGALHGFLKAAGTKLHHVKPHGALYNMAAKDPQLAEAIAQAVFDFDPELILYGLSGSKMIAAAQQTGLKAAAEVFADRTYQNDGTLTPRSSDNALITNSNLALAQVLMMIREQQVITVDHKKINIQAETICIHGDGPHAFAFAKKIFDALTADGITLNLP